MAEPIHNDAKTSRICKRLDEQRTIPLKDRKVLSLSQPYALASVLVDAGLSLRLNERAGRVEIAPADGGHADWVPMSDEAKACIVAYGGRVFASATPTLAAEESGKMQVRPWKPNQADWKLMLNACASTRAVDPFLAWVEDLGAWDGTDRVETWLVDLLGADDTEVNRWASRAILVGCLERGYRPGAQVRGVPVLIGPQNFGKSAAVKALVPDWSHEDWHADALDLQASGKEFAEMVAGRVLCEFAEMAGVRRSDIERLRNLLTRTNDGQHRGAYREFASGQLRRFMLVGTANDDGAGVLPNDPTGNTRFVSVTVAGASVPVEPWMEERRVQLWAEALHKYRAGVDGWVSAGFPRRLAAEQAALNDRYRTKNALREERISGLPDGPLGLEEIARLLGMLGDPFVGRERELSRGDQMMLAADLTACGWVKTRRRADGVKRWLWERAVPENLEAVEPVADSDAPVEPVAVQDEMWDGSMIDTSDGSVESVEVSDEVLDAAPTDPHVVSEPF